MTGNPSPRRGGAGVLTACVVLAAAVVLFAPSLVSTWVGGLVGDIWATALAAITALLSGLFGG